MDKKRLYKLQKKLEAKNEKVQYKKTKGTEKLYFKILNLIIKNIDSQVIDITFPVNIDSNRDYYINYVIMNNSKKVVGKTYINLLDLTFKLKKYGINLNIIDHYVEKGILKFVCQIQVNTYDFKSIVLDSNNTNSKQKIRKRVN